MNAYYTLLDVVAIYDSISHPSSSSSPNNANLKSGSCTRFASASVDRKKAKFDLNVKQVLHYGVYHSMTGTTYSTFEALARND